MRDSCAKIAWKHLQTDSKLSFIYYQEIIISCYYTMLVVRHLCLLPHFSFKPPNGNDRKRLAEFDIFMFQALLLLDFKPDLDPAQKWKVLHQTSVQENNKMKCFPASENILCFYLY